VRGQKRNPGRLAGAAGWLVTASVVVAVLAAESRLVDAGWGTVAATALFVYGAIDTIALFRRLRSDEDIAVWDVAIPVICFSVGGYLASRDDEPLTVVLFGIAFAALAALAAFLRNALGLGDEDEAFSDDEPVDLIGEPDLSHRPPF
jgi:uncharacterized membrane protein YfcA